MPVSDTSQGGNWESKGYSWRVWTLLEIKVGTYLILFRQSQSSNEETVFPRLLLWIKRSSLIIQAIHQCGRPAFWKHGWPADWTTTARRREWKWRFEASGCERLWFFQLQKLGYVEWRFLRGERDEISIKSFWKDLEAKHKNSAFHPSPSVLLLAHTAQAHLFCSEKPSRGLIRCLFIIERWNQEIEPLFKKSCLAPCQQNLWRQ